MIKYFYLEVGGLKIFQPQNEYTGEGDIGPDVFVRYHPEFDGTELFLNGVDEKKKFLIITTDVSLGKYLKQIKLYNERGS